MERCRNFAYVVSKNRTRTCWVLQCAIKKMDEAALARLASNRERYFSFIRKAEELAAKYYDPKSERLDNVIGVLTDTWNYFSHPKLDAYRLLPGNGRSLSAPSDRKR